MTRDYAKETVERVAFIKDLLKESGASGIVYGNSGGKDSALVGILCKMACENTVGIMMPCSKRNFSMDIADAMEVAKKFCIETKTVDISRVKEALEGQLSDVVEISPMASANIAPRLRMTTLYAYAGSNNMLVAGTGNRTEGYIGYFTKWGDGAHDFNPISDLTVKEIYEFLTFLDCPRCIIEKEPSAGLFDGQTDEKEIGIKYSNLDEYLLTGSASAEIVEKVELMHKKSEHKRRKIKQFKD